MYKIKFLVSIVIITTCCFQSTLVYGMEPEEKQQNGVEEACHRLITRKELPKNFFEIMEGHEQRSGTTSNSLPILKEKEEKICRDLGIDCKITPIEEGNGLNPYTPSPLNTPNLLLDEAAVGAFGGELEDFNTSFGQLKSMGQESSITLKTEEETGRKEKIKIALKNLNKPGNRTYEFVLDLIRETRNLWVSLYQGEERKSKEKEEPLHKAAFLYCFQAREFANILKNQQPYSHQQTDNIIKFPELCYAFAQQERQSNIKQQFIVAGLRSLELNESYFSPDRIKTNIINDSEEKKLPITIQLLQELNNIFQISKKPVDCLKKMSIIEDNHPLQASIYYKLMGLYKHLFAQGTVCFSSLKGMKKVDRSGLEIELAKAGLEALMLYQQALTPSSAPGKKLSSSLTEEEIKAIYYERVLAIMDRLDRWLPDELLKSEQLTYKSFYEESNKFLAIFYAKKEKNLSKEDPVRYEYIYKAAICFDASYTCINNKMTDGTYSHASPYIDESMSNKRKALFYAVDYISYIKKNIMKLFHDDVFDKVIQMYAIAKNTTAEKDFPILEKTLAPLYAKKSEGITEKIGVRSEYVYKAAKNYEVFNDEKALNYALSYILMAKKIKTYVREFVGEDDESIRALHMFNLAERLIKDQESRNFYESLKTDYFNPITTPSKPEDIDEIFHIDDYIDEISDEAMPAEKVDL